MVPDGYQIWLVPTAQVRAWACCCGDEVGALVLGSKATLAIYKKIVEDRYGRRGHGLQVAQNGEVKQGRFFCGGGSDLGGDHKV